MQDLRGTGNKVVTERGSKSKREIKEEVWGTKQDNRHMWKLISTCIRKETEDLSKAVQAAIGRRISWGKKDSEDKQRNEEGVWQSM
jgi:hypothetical protein